MWGTSPTSRERPEDAHGVNVRDEGDGVKLDGRGGHGEYWVLRTWYLVTGTKYLHATAEYLVLRT